MLNQIKNLIDARYHDMIEIRRYLHAHPELSFKETQTAKYIQDFYRQLQVPFTADVNGTHGVIATITGDKPGKTIGLRADFDALPIHEATDLPYQSTNPGVMHACGHDGHTATLLVLAKILNENKTDLPGKVVLIHQPAEEQPPGGAKPMLDSGLLDECDAIYGTHLWATVPLGEIQTREGVFMAGTDRFKIKVKGQGGHGAYPHETKDALVVGAELVTKLQTIVSRKVSPLENVVVTIGIFKSGESFNVIADEAVIEGTVRYLEKPSQATVSTELERIVQGVCVANGVDYDYDYSPGYPPLNNHAAGVSLIFDAAKSLEEIKKTTEVEPQMGGEDFAYYTIHKPGAYFFTGAKPDGKEAYPHHHPKFDINEKALPIAAKMLATLYFSAQKN